MVDNSLPAGGEKGVAFIQKPSPARRNKVCRRKARIKNVTESAQNHLNSNQTKRLRGFQQSIRFDFGRGKGKRHSGTAQHSAREKQSDPFYGVPGNEWPNPRSGVTQTRSSSGVTPLKIDMEHQRTEESL